MTNKIFLESSRLIEPLKGNKVDFYKLLISDLTNELFINDIEVREYLYYILAFSCDVAAKALQRKNKIKDTITNEAEIISPLNNFNVLHGIQRFLSEIPLPMAHYNLHPNDATILATCKLHRTKLASHDSDFIVPCKEENIELIRDITNS